MKNLYTSMMALACAGMMYAQLPAQQSECIMNAFPNAQNVKSGLQLTEASVHSQIPLAKGFKAKSKTTDNQPASRALGTEIDWDTLNPEDYADAFEFEYLGEGYFYDPFFTGMEIPTPVYEAKDHPGLYRYDNVWSTILGEDAKPLYIDATDPDLVVIPYQPTGLMLGEDGELWVLNEATYQHMLTTEPYAALYDDLVDNKVNMYVPTDNPMVYMPPKSFLVQTPEGQDASVFYLTDTEAMYALIPGEGYDLIPQWAEPQPCSISNGMVLGALQGVTITEQKTTMQYNNWEQGAYLRVLSPNLDLGMRGGVLEMSTYIPECVILGYQNTYIDITGRGPLWIMSRANLYESLEEFQASEDAPYAITYDPETLRISFPASSVLFNFPEWAGNEGSLFMFSTPEGFIQLDESWKDPAGVKDIESDVIDTNAPKVYYNLQGVQVANPTAGQIYIVKQGSKVTKQVIR